MRNRHCSVATGSFFFYIPGDVAMCCYSWFLVTQSHRRKRSKEGGCRGACNRFSYGIQAYLHFHVGLHIYEWNVQENVEDHLQQFIPSSPRSANSYNAESTMLQMSPLKSVLDFLKQLVHHNLTVSHILLITPYKLVWKLAFDIYGKAVKNWSLIT